jgi:hypothetical protein
MLKKEVCISLTCCFFALGLAAQAQTRKAGLWEVTANTRMQKPGSQVGMFSQTDSGAATMSNTTPLASCYTQEMIDNYGILFPPSLRDCQLSNTVKKPSSINADLTCSGRSNGKGSTETVWSDPDHATSVIHFVVKQKQGPNTISMGWTQEATAVFKSSDCGDVKPRTVPPAK